MFVHHRGFHQFVIEHFAHSHVEVTQFFAVKQNLSLRKPRLNTLFKRVSNVYFLACGHEHEGDLCVLEHVEDAVKHHLLGRLDVEVDVLQDEQQAHVLLMAKVLFDLLDHFNSVVFVDTFQVQSLAELGEDLALSVVEDRVDSDDLEILVVAPLFFEVLHLLLHLVQEGVDGLLVPTQQQHTVVLLLFEGLLQKSFHIFELARE